MRRWALLACVAMFSYAGTCSSDDGPARHRREGAGRELRTADEDEAWGEEKLLKAGHQAGWTRRLPGTTTQLANIVSSLSFSGTTVEVVNGRSKAHVYRATSPHAKGGIAIAKMWCMPDEFSLVDESLGRKYCNLDNARTTIQRMLSLQKVTDECGLSDMAPRMWHEVLVAEIPEKGYILQRRGLMQDIAPGVSLLGLTESADPQTVLDVIRKINSTQVVRGAIYDLLFTMCDRHLGNVFVDEEGNITLIDNDQAFGLTDEKYEMCSLSSVFLPTTQCHAIAALGKEYAKRRRTHKDPTAPSPGVTLDYRCHAPGGKIGTNYPDTVAKCIKKLASMRADAIQREYGFPTALAAYHLKVRAWTMIHLGFEFALYHGAPQNPACETFTKSQPCCKMELDPGKYASYQGSSEANAAGEYMHCMSPVGWHPTRTIPPACTEAVQLEEDLSYAGVAAEESCKACNKWFESGGVPATPRRPPVFSARIPDHAWEEHEPLKDWEI